MNPSGRDYSLYSPVHNSYSRADYFLVDARLIPSILNAKYHSTVISDHSPLTFSLCSDHVDKTHASWKLNLHFLTENFFRWYIKYQISLYFEMNDNPDTSPSILWEAFKAYIRGCIILSEASRRKENKTKWKGLEDQIKAASSDEWALAVHARQGLFSQHLPLWKSFLYNSVACSCQYQIMYAEVRKTVWTAAWFPGQRLSRRHASGAGWGECPHEAWCKK